MYTSSPASHKQTAKSSKFRKQFQIATVCVLLNKALQALKETPEDCENTFLYRTNNHRFHVHKFKLFFLQRTDQIDSDSLVNTLFSRFPNQNYSLDIFHEHKNTDAEQYKNEVINVFTQAEIVK